MKKHLISVQSGDWYDDNDHAPSMKRLADLGFEAIDYNIDHILYPWKYVKGEEDAPIAKLPLPEFIEHYRPMKEAAEENGIVFSQMHAPFPLFIDGKDEFNDFAIEVASKIIAVCDFVDCRALVIHPYASQSGDKQHEFEVNFAFYRKLIPVAKQYNVKICLENIPRWLPNSHIIAGCCCDPDEACYYIDSLNEEAGEDIFGFCYDVGHGNITARDIKADLKILGKRLTILHIHDNNTTSDQHLVPYTCFVNGKIALDWEGFLDGLREIGYEGTLSFETYNGTNKFPEPVRDDVLRLICSIGRYFRSRLEA